MRIPDFLKFKRTNSARGSSSIKTVYTVGIIGLLVKVVIPIAGAAVEQADNVRDSANARSAISVCSTARAAGLNFEDDNGNVLATLIRLSNGEVVERGVFRGSVFQLPMGVDEMFAVEDLLEIRHGCLMMRDRIPGQ
ncbi:MAG: hypothetical protein ACI8UO_002518 [Verrucomicrobiales bacterium]|jgi:hypothetical protein